MAQNMALRFVRLTFQLEPLLSTWSSRENANPSQSTSPVDVTLVEQLALLQAQNAMLQAECKRSQVGS